MNGFPEEDDMGLAKDHKLQQEIDQQNQNSKIKIAIAKACGWTDTLIVNNKYKKTDIPDYLNDINAMHEEEKILTKERLYGYEN